MYQWSVASLHYSTYLDLVSAVTLWQRDINVSDSLEFNLYGFFTQMLTTMCILLNSGDREVSNTSLHWRC